MSLIEQIETEGDVSSEDILLESKMSDLVGALGNRGTYASFLLLFHSVLDEAGVFLYEHWEDAFLVEPPEKDEFWFTVKLAVEKDADLAAMKRLKNYAPQTGIKTGSTKRFRIIEIDLQVSKMEEIHEIIQQRVEDFVEQNPFEEEPLT